METPDISVRAAEPSDWVTIVEYNYRLAAETEDTFLNLETLTKGVQTLLADARKGFYCVAEAGGEIVGQIMVTYEWSDWRNGLILWIQSVYVRAEWRRRGVFRRLYEAVQTAGNAAGAVGIRLYVVQENAPAIATYKRLGMSASPYVVMEEFPEETK